MYSYVEAREYWQYLAELAGSEFSLEDLGTSSPDRLKSMRIKVLLIKVIMNNMLATVYQKATKYLSLSREIKIKES